MAKVKYDGVVEAAHFNPDGLIDWVRVYERKGAIFSDCLILKRQAFIDELKAGKRYVIGERIENMGGMFKVSQPLRLYQHNGTQMVVVGEGNAASIELAGIPII